MASCINFPRKFKMPVGNVDRTPFFKKSTYSNCLILKYHHYPYFKNFQVYCNNNPQRFILLVDLESNICFHLNWFVSVLTRVTGS